MPNHDGRQQPGDRGGGTSASVGPVDRHGIANLALAFADIAATLSALARECDSLEGTELSRQVLAIESELGNTEMIVSETRRYLRDIARSALMK